MEAKYHICVLDDEDYYRDYMTRLMDPWCKVTTFHKSSELEAFCESGGAKDVDLFVIDYDLGNGTAVKSDIANYLKGEVKSTTPVALYSLLTEFGEDDEYIRKNFDYVLPKRNLEAGTLHGILQHIEVLES